MSMKLYVGNLSFNTSSEDLQELFAQAGTVESSAVVEDAKRSFTRLRLRRNVIERRSAGGHSEINGTELAVAALTVRSQTARRSRRRRRNGGGGGRGGTAAAAIAVVTAVAVHATKLRSAARP